MVYCTRYNCRKPGESARSLQHCVWVEIRLLFIYEMHRHTYIKFWVHIGSVIEQQMSMEHWRNCAAREKRCIRRKKSPITTTSNMMPHEEAWTRNRASKFTGQRKPDCAMTRSEFFNLQRAQRLYCVFNLEGRWVKNVARMGQKRNSHVFEAGKPERITWNA
jgi:hypothetical protein